MRAGFPQLDNEEKHLLSMGKTAVHVQLLPLQHLRQQQESLNYCYLNRPLFICAL